MISKVDLGNISIWVSAFNSPVKNLRWSFSVKIVNGWNLLIIFLKSFTLNARLCSEYASNFRYEQSLLWWGTDIPNTHQGRRKLFYGRGSWVKMSASLKKKHTQMQSKKKKKFGLKYKWLKMSYFWNSFLDNIISGTQRFYVCPDVPVDIIRVFF